MSFSISPGVTVSEFDLTTTIPALPASIGGIAGKFVWGPVNEVVTVSNEVQLVERFGRPAKNANDAIDFFSAANFLSYSNNLKVVRVDGTSCGSASWEGVSATNAKNSITYDTNYGSLTGVNATYGPFIARFPGELGNSLKVGICDASDAAANSWAEFGGLSTGDPGTSYSTLFDTRPNTSIWVADKGGSYDEVHVIVIDEDGLFTGVKNQVLEKFEYLSRATDAKNVDGSSNYYREVINRKSKYIYWSGDIITDFSKLSNSDFSTDYIDTGANPAFASFDGGNNGTSTSSNYIDSYNRFANSEEVEVGLIIGSNANSQIANHITGLVSASQISPNGDIEGRKDCVVFVSPPREAVVNNYGNEATDVIAHRGDLDPSSYAVMDSGWKYQYDKYNDRYLWTPLNGDIAGLCAKTDADRDPWFSPGGFNRGYIKNIVKLAWNPNKTDRDLIYAKQINPVVSFPGQGTVLFGDKTMQNRPSAFDRINVRRLFIYLEKAISVAARYSLFEFNDSFTRAQFVNLVEPYLRDVQGKRGITDFRVVCDETNNTPEIIDRNEFIGDIYIKPARSINYIQLNFVATRTGVSFDEIVGQF